MDFWRSGMAEGTRGLFFHSGRLCRLSAAQKGPFSIAYSRNGEAAAASGSQEHSVWISGKSGIEKKMVAQSGP